MEQRITLLRSKIKSNRKDTPLNQQYKTFQLLLLNLALTYHSNPKELQQSIQELCQIHDKLFLTSEKDPKTIEVLTDLFVSWLSESHTTVMRDTIESAFQSFCPLLTQTALDILFDVVKLKPEEEVEDDDEEEEEDDNPKMDRLSESNQTPKKLSSQAASSREHSESDIDDDNDDDDNTNPKHTAGTDTSDGNSEAGDDDLSDSSMDDEQMFKIDYALEEMLKLRSSTKLTKQQKQYARTEALQFKQRVLSLIDIFVTTQKSPLVAKVMIPLIESVIRVTNTKSTINLVQKIELIFNNLCKRIIPINNDPVCDELHEIMEKLFEIAKTTKEQTVVRLCGSGISLLIRSLLQPSKSQDDIGYLNITQLRDNFTSCLNTFFASRKSKLGSGFFTNIFSQSAKVGYYLIPSITHSMTSTPKKMKKLIALDWLLMFLRKKKGYTRSSFLDIITHFYTAFQNISKCANLKTPELRKFLNLFLLAIQETIRHHGLSKAQELFPLAEVEQTMSSAEKFFKPSSNTLRDNIFSLLRTGFLSHEWKKRNREKQQQDSTTITTTVTTTQNKKL
eukprot:TRINITY_DN12846_c0_g1_i1.p1 TRINITY_DN12846_c0_g1~~TRINITY_DN12846_c0_g1_i1.p1  ORF type:complete len:616 (+),score=129.61 TRINITY_DN12846_c0_g1_i1:161-1849(+)